MGNNSNNSPWEYIKSNQFQKAVDIYTRLYQLDGDVTHLRNRAIALMNLQQFNLAMEDFIVAIDLTEPSYQNSGDFTSIGVCYWCLDMSHKALEFWKKAERAPYTNYGGVTPLALQVFHAMRLEEWARVHKTQAKLKAQTYHRDSWPGLVTSLLTGEARFDEVGSFIASYEAEPFRQRLWCQADFYFAMFFYISGDREKFKEGITKSANNPNGYLEKVFYIAKHEIEK